MAMKRSSSPIISVKKFAKIEDFETSFKSQITRLRKALSQPYTTKLHKPHKIKTIRVKKFIVPSTLENQKPDKIKTAKKAEVIKKKLQKNEKKNMLSKKIKGKPNTLIDEKPTEKPNWKEFKKEKQELRLKRKEKKGPFNDTVYLAKKIYENLQDGRIPKEDKDRQLAQLFRVTKPDLEKMVYLHDTARIIQCMMKLGTPEVRSQIIHELMNHVPKMLLSKYACLCIKNMFKFGSPLQRQFMIHSLKGKIYKLIMNSNAATIMDLIYTTYATSEQQNTIMHELYGASSALCGSSDISSFYDVLDNAPYSRDIILAKTKENIKKLVLKQNSSVQTALVHNFIYEYMSYTGGQNCEELFTSLKELPIDTFFTSKRGCLLAMYIVWSSTPKEKKSILKQIKTSGATLDLATSEFGYLILLALFDNVDDTVLIKKTIIPDILKNLDTIAPDEYGRRVILYLVSWRDSLYFHPKDIELLKKGDLIKESKKDDEVRVKELLSGVIDHFLQNIKENPDFWLSSGSIAMVLYGILKSGSGEKLKEAMTSVAEYLVKPEKNVDERINNKNVGDPVYEHPGLHVVLRKIIRNDHILLEKNEATFSEILSSVITQETLQTWVHCNRACFLLIALMESNVEVATKNIKSLMSVQIMTLLKEKTYPGAKILVTKVKS